MRFRPDHYLEASQERIDDARRLHNMKRYAAAIYLAGVAVECLLIAYKTRKNAEFESRHDLVSLLRECGIADFIHRRDRIKLSAMLGEVWVRWKNNYRFASQGRLLSEFKRLKLDKGLKGDILKPNSDIIISNALEIIKMGVLRWTSKRN